MATTTTHRLAPQRSALHGQFSSDLDPALTIASGDTVQYRIPDVAWGLENHRADGGPRRKVEPRTSPRDDGPCLAGPVYVEGAEPGDVLAIHIETIVPGEWGWTLAGEMDFFNTALNRQLGVAEGGPAILRWTLEGNGEAVDQHGHRVAVRPMLGTIGGCPAGDGWHSGWTPRRTGGNLDAAVLTAGSVLYLPVEVEGALVSVGDGHAAQGHGESSGTGIECLMERVDLRYVVRTDLDLEVPRAETPRGWVTFGLGDTLDEATVVALQGMLDWLTTVYDLSRKKALALASVCVDLEITQVVNGVCGAHAVLSTDARQRLFTSETR